MCVSSSYKDSSHTALGPILITSLKTLQIQSHSEVLEVRVLTYDFGQGGVGNMGKSSNSATL